MPNSMRCLIWMISSKNVEHRSGGPLIHQAAMALTSLHPQGHRKSRRTTGMVAGQRLLHQPNAICVAFFEPPLYPNSPPLLPYTQLPLYFSAGNVTCPQSSLYPSASNVTCPHYPDAPAPVMWSPCGWWAAGARVVGVQSYLHLNNTRKP